MTYRLRWSALKWISLIHTRYNISCELCLYTGAIFSSLQRVMQDSLGFAFLATLLVVRICGILSNNHIQR